MVLTQKYLDELSYQIIGCAIEVSKDTGPGLLESLYEKCFAHELTLRGIGFERQRSVPMRYKEMLLDAELRYDLLVEDCIIVELKAIEAILPVHEATLLTYMRLLEKPKGILINFNTTNIFKYGQKTLVNKFYGELPKF